MTSPNVPELCETLACVEANAHSVTGGQVTLFAMFMVAVVVTLSWPEPGQ